MHLGDNILADCKSEHGCGGRVFVLFTMSKASVSRVSFIFVGGRAVLASVICSSGKGQCER